MNNVCKNCKGGLRCNNSQSPCCGYFCGEYPGTGKVYEGWKKENISIELEVVEELYDDGTINIHAELHRIYSKALITYEMSRDELLEIADSVSDRVADLIVEIMEK